MEEGTPIPRSSSSDSSGHGPMDSTRAKTSFTTNPLLFVQLDQMLQTPAKSLTVFESFRICGWFPFHPKVLVHCAKVWFPFTFNCHPFRLPLPRPLHVSTADPSRLRLTLPVLHWEFHVCIKHQLCSQGWFYAQNIKNTMLRATNSSGLLLTFLMSCIHG